MRDHCLRIKEIPVPKSAAHEEPRYEVLPKHEFTLVSSVSD